MDEQKLKVILEAEIEDSIGYVETEATKEDEIDFFEDPKKYVSKAVEQHPAVKEAKEQALEIKRAQTLARLQQEFPGFQQTVSDPEFAEWVKASPVRLKHKSQ